MAALVGLLVTRTDLFASRSASTLSVGRPAPADKQILRVTESESKNGGDLSAIDPALIQVPGDYDKAQLVFPPLITLDDAGNAVDWAAQSHEVSQDGLTWTFHLRSGMRWSDGMPIDATTYAYSINRALDPCFASPVASYLYNIAGAPAFSETRNCKAGKDGLSTDTLVGRSIAVADPLTLKLTLGAPAAYFLGAFSFPTSWAVPKQLIDRYGQAKWTDHLADGAGFGGNLYKVTTWDHKRHFALAANGAFWSQKPMLQKIAWTLYQGNDAAWADYLTGVGDVGFPTTNDLPHARTLPGYHEVPTLTVSYLRVNWALAPFDDVRVRNAFSLSIDRQAVATHVDNGAAAPTIHMIIQGLPGYNSNLKNAAGDSGDTALSANLPKAQELAKSYAADKCGGDFSRCAPINYIFPIDNHVAFLNAQAFLSEWQTAFPGWRITVQGLERETEIKTFREIQIGADGWVADYPDPQDFTSVLWTKDAGSNQSSVDVPEADALEQQADVSTDATGRLVLYQRAEQLLVTAGAFIALAQPVSTWVVRPSSKLVTWRLNPEAATSLATWRQAYISA
jgi:peptide/nickel transport system substrate-binding protein/oligopeptide transport system substrate-binding protein